MEKWVLVFLSIWIIISAFLLKAGALLIINNLITAFIMFFYSFKLTSFKKWLGFAIAAFTIVAPFLPSVSGIISQVNDTSKNAVIRSSNVYTKDLLIGILLSILILFPQKEKKSI